MISLYRYFRRKIKAHHVDAYSAQAAFFLLFSLVPLLLLLFASVKAFSIPMEIFLDSLKKMLPRFLEQWIAEIMHDVFRLESMGLTWFSVIAVIWSASKCVYYIIGGLNSIFELKEQRPYWMVRILSVFYTFVFILAITMFVLIMFFGSYFSKRLAIDFPTISKYVIPVLSARYFLGLIAFAIFFVILYAKLPAKKFHFCEMLPGAIVSAVGWVIFTSIFAFYIESFSNYSLLYGGLTSIIVFMLWLYICMQIVFWGAEINLLFSKMR